MATTTTNSTRSRDHLMEDAAHTAANICSESMETVAEHDNRNSSETNTTKMAGIKNETNGEPKDGEKRVRTWSFESTEEMEALKKIKVHDTGHEMEVIAISQRPRDQPCPSPVLVTNGVSYIERSVLLNNLNTARIEWQSSITNVLTHNFFSFCIYLGSNNSGLSEARLIRVIPATEENTVVGSTRRTHRLPPPDPVWKTDCRKSTTRLPTPSLRNPLIRSVHAPVPWRRRRNKRQTRTVSCHRDKRPTLRRTRMASVSCLQMTNLGTARGLATKIETPRVDTIHHLKRERTWTWKIIVEHNSKILPTVLRKESFTSTETKTAVSTFLPLNSRRQPSPLPLNIANILSLLLHQPITDTNNRKQQRFLSIIPRDTKATTTKRITVENSRNRIRPCSPVSGKETKKTCGGAGLTRHRRFRKQRHHPAEAPVGPILRKRPDMEIMDTIIFMLRPLIFLEMYLIRTMPEVIIPTIQKYPIIIEIHHRYISRLIALPWFAVTILVELVLRLPFGLLNLPIDLPT